MAIEQKELTNFFLEAHKDEWEEYRQELSQRKMEQSQPEDDGVVDVKNGKITGIKNAEGVILYNIKEAQSFEGQDVTNNDAVRKLLFNNEELYDLHTTTDQEEFVKKYGKLEPMSQELMRQVYVVHDKNVTTAQLAQLYTDYLSKTIQSGLGKINKKLLQKFINTLPSNASSYLILQRLLTNPSIKLDDKTLDALKKVDTILKENEKLYGSIYSYMTDYGIRYFKTLLQNNNYSVDRTLEALLINRDKLPKDMFVSDRAKNEYLKQIAWKLTAKSADKEALEETLTSPINIAEGALFTAVGLGAVKTGVKPVDKFLKMFEVENPATREFLKKYGLPLNVISSTVDDESLIVGIGLQPEIFHSIFKALKGIGKASKAVITALPNSVVAKDVARKFKVTPIKDVSDIVNGLVKPKEETVISQVVGETVGQAAVNSLKTGKNGFKRIVGTDVWYATIDKEGKALSDAPLVGKKISKFKYDAKEVTVDYTVDITDTGKVELKINKIENPINFEDALIHKSNLLGEPILAKNIEDGLSKVAVGLFGEDVKRQVVLDFSRKLRSISKQLKKDPLNEKLVDEFFDTINTGIEDLYDYTFDYIKSDKFKDVFETTEQMLKDETGKSLISSLFANFKYNFTSPFIKDKLVKQWMINLPSRLHDYMTILDKTMMNYVRGSLKLLSPRQRKILNRLLIDGDEIGREWGIETIERHFGKKVALAYKTIRAFYNKAGEILDRELTNYLKSQGFAKYKDRVVQVLGKKKLPSKTTNKLIKVMDMETEDILEVPMNELKELDKVIDFHKGYIPRLPEGRLVVSVVDKKTQKVIKEVKGLKNFDDVREVVGSMKIDNTKHKLIVHSIDENPVNVKDGNATLKALYDVFEIKGQDNIADSLIKLGVDEDKVIDFISQFDKNELRDYFGTVTSVTGRAKRRFKGAKELYKHVLKRRMLATDTVDLYIRTLTKYAGFEQLREKFKIEFIKKYKHLLKETGGIVDWRYFREDAYKHPDYLAAKLFQDQLRRWYNAPNKHVEKLAYIISKHLDIKRYESVMKELGFDEGDVKINLTKTFDKLNKALTTIGYSMKFAADVAQILLQGSQGLITVMAHPDIALQATKKAGDILAYALADHLGLAPNFKFLSKIKDDYEILINSGLFSTLLPEEANALTRIAKRFNMFIVGGEAINRIIAGSVALLRAEELGLKRGTQEFLDYVANYGKQFALDMSRFSRRNISEGMLAWNIGQFKRYFFGMIDLFYKEMTPRQRFLTGLYLYELYGLKGIPLAGDIQAFYEHYEPQLRTMLAQNLLLFQDTMDTSNPEEYLKQAYEKGYMSKDTYAKYLDLLERQKLDPQTLKKIENERYLNEIVEETKDIMDIADKIFNRKGLAAPFSDRLAFNSFLVQMFSQGALSLTGSLVSSIINATIPALKYIHRGALLDSLIENEILETGDDPDKEPKYLKGIVSEKYRIARRAFYNLAPGVTKTVLDVLMAYGIMKEQDIPLKEAWDEIDGFIIYSAKSNPTIVDAGLKDLAKYILGMNFEELNLPKALQYKYAEKSRILHRLAKEAAKMYMEYVEAGEFDKALQMDIMFRLGMRSNVESPLTMKFMQAYNQYKKQYLIDKNSFRNYTPVETIKILNKAKAMMLLTDEEYNEAIKKLGLQEETIKEE